MASSKEYIDFVSDQCKCPSARAMMGKYVLYYGGKVVGGVMITACLYSLRHPQKHLCR